MLVSELTKIHTVYFSVYTRAHTSVGGNIAGNKHYTYYIFRSNE